MIDEKEDSISSNNWRKARQNRRRWRRDSLELEDGFKNRQRLRRELEEEYDDLTDLINDEDAIE